MECCMFVSLLNYDVNDFNLFFITSILCVKKIFFLDERGM